MIRHEAIGMNDDAPALMGLSELVQEDVAIFIVKENIAPGDTACGDVVKGARIIDAQWACQKASPQLRVDFQCKAK